jgi:hypothetical protein
LRSENVYLYSPHIPLRSENVYLYSPNIPLRSETIWLNCQTIYINYLLFIINSVY